MYGADVKKDFGAVGDGKADDTAAFLKAFSSLPGGALYVPPGRWGAVQA
jgi:polygalacturonase